MGYRFRGFFTTGGRDIGEAAAREWPFVTWRTVADPFTGVGVRCPDRETDDDAEEEALLERVYTVPDQLPDFSRRFPGLTFVFVDADCFGSVCVYTGFVVRNGEVVRRVSHEEANEAGSRSLDRLLEPLGVTLKAGYFAPFVRGFWGER